MFFYVRHLLLVSRFWSILSLFLLSFAQQSISQGTAFIPVSDDPGILPTVKEEIEKNYARETSSLPLENRKEMKQMYKVRHDNIKSKFEKKEIHTSPTATAYLQKLAQQIINANPSLRDQKVSCYFSRSGVPNASYLGEGIIIFNMGLFQRLHNESQAAFILCHELAHYYLHHSDNSILKYVTTINSEEVQQQLHNIKRSQFNKRVELEKLLKNVNLDSRHHTRDHESQADSMGVEFLRNTGFDVSESLSTLALLDSIDVDSLETEECLQRTFDAPGYRFQKKWLARETGLLGGHAVITNDTALADSLKTHPDCASRIRYIEPLVMRYKSPLRQKFVVDETMFNELKMLFEYEIVEYAFVSGNCTRSLLYTLALLDKKPADPYLVTQTGKIFNRLYAAQKKHELGKLIDLPSPGFPSNYNILLQFIQNLYLEDYAAISYHYLNKYQSTIRTYAPFLTEYHTSIEIVK